MEKKSEQPYYQANTLLHIFSTIFIYFLKVFLLKLALQAS